MSSTLRIRGRPRGEIRSKVPELSAFFALAEELNLSLVDIENALKGAILFPPSYRAIQEWRRGTRSPKFVTMELWRKALVVYAKKKGRKSGRTRLENKE